MPLSRRNFCAALVGSSALALTGCASKYGQQSSYITNIVEKRHLNPVFHWLDIVMQQVRDQRVPPPRAAYNFAMPLAAGFLAANGIQRQYEQHLNLPDGPVGADAEIAYGVAFAVAAAEVLQTPFIGETHAFLSRYPNGQSKDQSIEWGRKVGHQVVRMRTDDGSEPSEVNYDLNRYKRRKDALKWSPTGPFYSASPGPAFGSFARGLFPGQGQIKPWTMSSSNQFRARNFYDPASPEFAREFETIRLLGAADSPIRTADQSEIALFWEDGPWGITPSGHFMQFAMQILQYQPMGFIELARSFALLGMTQCDASISAWDNKYYHDIIRPETAIRVRAKKFFNFDPRVVLHSNWRSFIPTPEFPSYTSGHSTFGAAATKMISLFIGTDRISLTGKAPDEVLWPQLKGVTRHWTSLNQMAEENGLSRLYGGVHWELDHTEAMKAGHAIAQQAFDHLFPLRVR